MTRSTTPSTPVARSSCAPPGRDFSRISAVATSSPRCSAKIGPVWGSRLARSAPATIRIGRIDVNTCAARVMPRSTSWRLPRSRATRSTNRPDVDRAPVRTRRFRVHRAMGTSRSVADPGRRRPIQSEASRALTRACGRISHACSPCSSCRVAREVTSSADRMQPPSSRCLVGLAVGMGMNNLGASSDRSVGLRHGLRTPTDAVDGTAYGLAPLRDRALRAARGAAEATRHMESSRRRDAARLVTC